MGDVRKIKSGLVKFPFDQFVGEAGNLFFDPDTGSLFLSDGVTPGGIPVGGGGGGGGDVNKFGTPVNDQLAIWRNSSTIEGDSRLTWNGTNFSITGNLVVSGTVDGRDVSADGSKLDSIEAGATADMSAAEIKAAYESNPNTNPFTDALETKLLGIEAGATADQTAAEITASLDTYLGSTEWRTGGTGASSVSELTDVDLTGLADGYILVYDAPTLTWKVEANAGGSASAIADLTDVDLTGLSNNDILVYDSVSSTWKPEPNTGGTGGTAFMPQVDLIDDTNATYYYFGWVDNGNGDWQINRQTRANALIVRADSINNITIPDLATAWPLRAGLTYS